MNKTFIIDYSYGHLHGKRTKVHNCINEFDAKGKLHNYLTKKHGRKKFIITSCNEEDYFGLLKDILKS